MSSICLSFPTTIQNGSTDQWKENYNGMWVNLVKFINLILSIKDMGVSIYIYAGLLQTCRSKTICDWILTPVICPGRWEQLWMKEVKTIQHVSKTYTDLHAVNCKTHRSAQSNTFPRLVLATGYLYLLKLKTETGYLIYLTYGELSRRNKRSHIPSGSQSILFSLKGVIFDWTSHVEDKK